MERVSSIDKLDKPIREYSVRSCPEANPEEREIIINYMPNDEEEIVMTAHSNIREGNEWCVSAIDKGSAELDFLYLDDNRITSIGITSDKDLVKLQNPDIVDSVEDLNQVLTFEASTSRLNKVRKYDSLDNLPESLEEMKIRDPRHLRKQQKRMETSIFYDDEDEEYKIDFYAEKSTAIKWAVRRVLEDEAEVNFLYTQDYDGEETICMMCIRTSAYFLSFKENQYSAKRLSSIF